MGLFLKNTITNMLRKIKSKYIQIKNQIIRYFEKHDMDIDRYMREMHAMNHHHHGVAVMYGYLC